MTNREIFTKIFNNPTFKDSDCKKSCIGIPCGFCSWWDEESEIKPIKALSFKICDD